MNTLTGCFYNTFFLFGTMYVATSYLFVWGLVALVSVIIVFILFYCRMVMKVRELKGEVSRFAAKNDQLKNVYNKTPVMLHTVDKEGV